MPRARLVPIDEVLALASFAFIVLELGVKDQRDLPGLLRYRLESILPRGLEGLRFFFRRIGRSKRFLVTLVKEPAPESFVPARTCLPFALQLPEKEDRATAWVSRNATFSARYEEGILTSVEIGALDASAVGMIGGGEAPPAGRTREALDGGLSLQQAVGRDDLIRKIAAAALGLALVAQLAFTALQAVSTRQTRLENLERQIAMLPASADVDSESTLAAPDTGLQSLADEVQQGLSRRWIPGYCLETWALRAGTLRLEGWGPSALALLSSLRADPKLADLELATRQDEEGFESFVFEGRVGDD